MLRFLIDFAVPACLFMLMLIAGTEVTVADYSILTRNLRAVLIGSAVGSSCKVPLLLARTP
jgi:hypothetical protein